MKATRQNILIPAKGHVPVASLQRTALIVDSTGDEFRLPPLLVARPPAYNVRHIRLSISLLTPQNDR